APKVFLSISEKLWFAAAIFSGGIIAPVLLMAGLSSMSASGASLLLNMESVFTALLAWIVFKENVDRRIALGMILIVIGAVVLTDIDTLKIESIWPSLAIMGACLCWGIDNNLTRKVSLKDAAWIASVKGLIAGSVNLILAFVMGSLLPSLPTMAGAITLGFFAYGVSLTLFVLGLRNLGTARTGAYFSVAPFIGSLIAIGMGEPITLSLISAGLLMAVGLWLHLSEHHHHRHIHTETEHDHEHSHDEHHQHSHDNLSAATTTNSHQHAHAIQAHEHVHFPDAHHQHKH
ncbi:MAG: DMT family transporter, partial [Methylotenera sp.]